METCPSNELSVAGRAPSGVLRARQFTALASAGIRDLTRQPIVFLLTVTSVILVALASIQAFQFGEDGRIARDSGLAIHLLFGLIVGAYCACSTLSGEIRSGTALAVLSKPVSRDMFFAAKFAGLTLLVLLFSACVSAACLLGEKASPKLYIPDYVPFSILAGAVAASLVLGAIANYRLRRSFASTAFWSLLVLLVCGVFIAAALPSPAGRMSHGRLYLVVTDMQWRILPASMLVAVALTVLSGFALALATRLRTLPVLAVSTAILFVGLLSEYLFNGLWAGSPAAAVARRVLPNWQYFWAADALTGGGTVPLSYVGSAALYGILYLAASLAAGILLFRHREMR